MLRNRSNHSILHCIMLLLAALFLSGCDRPAPPKPTLPTLVFSTRQPTPVNTLSAKLGPSPTPDAARVLPTLRANSVDYYVDPGDTLGSIATQYGVALKSVIEANQIDDPNLIEPGQHLVIPPPVPGPTGPDFKIIPDSGTGRRPFRGNL